MRAYPRQKLYDVGHRQFFGAYLKGRLNDGTDGGFVEAFQRFLKTDREVVPLSRGRLGVFFAVKSAVREGRRRVLLSPFTIFDLVNMVIAAGGEPVFLDSEVDGPHLTLETIREELGDSVAAVIVTHYHTANPAIAEIAKIVRAKGAVLIEDCAIGLGGCPGGASVGLHGDFGVFSFGLFKFVATYFGGALVVKDQKIAAGIRREMAAWPQMDGTDLRPYLIKGLKLDTLTQPQVFSLLTFPLFRWGYVNDVSFIKRQAVNDPAPVFRNAMPEHYKRRPSDFQEREWTRQLPKVWGNRERRLANARAYRDELSSSNAIVCPPRPDDAADCFLNFPVLVQDRDRVLAELMRRGFDASQYYYRNCAELCIFAKYSRDLPQLTSYVDRVLVLPCYPEIPEAYARSLARALREIVGGMGAHPGHGLTGVA